jgi:glycosyltransferase involved in cell wall biosynthesis
MSSEPPESTALNNVEPHPLPPVMVLGDHFGYPGGIPHGVTSYFLQVLPALRAAGIDLTVCFLREPHPAADALREHGIFPIFLSARKWDPSVVLRIAMQARRSRVGLLHATGLKGTLMARAAARLMGAKTILHVHDLNEPGALLGAAQRLLARPTDLGVCVSEAVRTLTVNGYHVPPERVRVIHNGIRLHEIRDVPAGTRARVRRELSLHPDRPVMAMIGRMHPVKGHRTMLKILPAITQRCPDLVLLLVGDGPERAACETLARELDQQKHVRFLGQRSDIAQLLAAVDLVVMPSHSEGLGLAAVEALAAGRPVVAFDVGGLREVVSDDENGRLIAAGDCNAFAAAVTSIVHDRERCARYAERAVLDSARFTLEAHVRRLIACYREAASSDAVELATRSAGTRRPI